MTASCRPELGSLGQEPRHVLGGNSIPGAARLSKGRLVVLQALRRRVGRVEFPHVGPKAQGQGASSFSCRFDVDGVA